MPSDADKRSLARVEFSHDVPVRIVAIDGTWNRSCLMLDAAGEGAKLSLQQSVQGLNLKEFFLLLSTTGASFRHCELAWINGNEMGVRFIQKPTALSKLKKLDSRKKHEI